MRHRSSTRAAVFLGIALAGPAYATTTVVRSGNADSVSAPAALLTAIQGATAPASSTPPQAEVNGQPCTARELVGTWQLATKPRTPGVTSVLKHITPTHYFNVRLGASDVVQSGHGGPYTVANGTYTETIAHGFGGAFEEFRGAVVASSQCRISGDMLHIAGEYKGTKLDERWRRVTGTAAER